VESSRRFVFGVECRPLLYPSPATVNRPEIPFPERVRDLGPFRGGNTDPYLFHYHIRWAQIRTLGWECLNTRAEAEASAVQFVLQGDLHFQSSQRGDIQIPAHEWRALLPSTCARCLYSAVVKQRGLGANYRLNFLASLRATKTVTAVAATARIGTAGWSEAWGIMLANKARYRIRTTSVSPAHLRKPFVLSVNRAIPL